MASQKPPVPSKVTVKEDARTMVYREINRKLTTEEVEELEFDREGKGWIGNIMTPKHDLSPYKRLVDKKHYQRTTQQKSQKMMESKRSSSGSQKGSQGNVSSSPSAPPKPIQYSDDDTDETDLPPDDIDMEELFKTAPQIEDPFSIPKSDGEWSTHTKWKSPDNPIKKNSFNFERPSNEKMSSFTSPNALVSRLQKVIEDKDKQIAILQTQLLKIHRDSSVLAEEVAKRKGPDAAQLQRENKIMRDQLDRCLKENTVLRGLQMQSKNSTLKKFQKQFEQEDRHSCLNYRRRIMSAHTNGKGSTSGYQTGSKMSRSDGRSVSFSPVQDSIYTL